MRSRKANEVVDGEGIGTPKASTSNGGSISETCVCVAQLRITRGLLAGGKEQGARLRKRAPSPSIKPSLLTPFLWQGWNACLRLFAARRPP